MVQNENGAKRGFPIIADPDSASVLLCSPPMTQLTGCGPQ